MNLYNLTESYEAAINSMYNEEAGEITVDIDKLHGELDEKRLAVAAYIKNCQAEVGAIAKRVAELQKRQDGLDARASWLTALLLGSMKRTGTDKVLGLELDIKVIANPGKLVIEDETQIPSRFFKIKELKTLDKEGLKAEMISQKVTEMAGAKIVKTDRLQIK